MTAWEDRELVAPRDRAEWRAWLEAHHADSPAVRVLVLKKAARVPGVTYDEAVEEAVAFGWIDSTTHRHDDDRMAVMFARRKPGGTWARSNKERVARLSAEGRMAPAGLAAVEAAKADGSWDMLDQVERGVVPPDLAEALARHPEAQARFEAWPPSAKAMAIYRVTSVKRPDTRARRIAQIVEDAAADRRPVP